MKTGKIKSSDTFSTSKRREECVLLNNLVEWETEIKTSEIIHSLSRGLLLVIVLCSLYFFKRALRNPILGNIAYIRVNNLISEQY